MTPDTLRQIYDELYHLLEKRHLPVASINYFEGDDDEGDAIVYTYAPQKDDELDFMLSVVDAAFVCIAVGPFEFFTDSDAESKDFAEQLASAIQALLNGQLAVVLTERARDRHWRTAEMVLTDKGAKPITIMTIKNGGWGRGDSRVRVLQNNLTTDKIKLAGNFILPTHVNNKFVEGRAIDLRHPTPLTQKQFAKIEASEAVQEMGGNAGQADWMVFYRHIEFWIVCAIVGIPAVWAATLVPEGDMWWHEIVRGIIWAMAGGMITVISTAWLTARQAKIDRGEKPLIDSDSWYISSYVFLMIFSLPMLWAIYFAPIWTPLADPKHLYNGLSQTKELWLINTSVALMLGGLLFTRGARITRALRFMLFSGGYGLLVCVNYVLFASSDTSGAAESPELPTICVTILPAAIILWLLVDVIRKAPVDDPLKRDW